MWSSSGDQAEQGFVHEISLYLTLHADRGSEAGEEEPAGLQLEGCLRKWPRDCYCVSKQFYKESDDELWQSLQSRNVGSLGDNIADGHRQSLGCDYSEYRNGYGNHVDPAHQCRFVDARSTDVPRRRRASSAVVRVRIRVPD